MKKRILAVLLTAAMAISMLAGCGGSKVASDGKVLNVYCWNDEFQRRVQDHYPGYEIVDTTTGKIGDVTVKWNITPTTDNAYQNNLDNVLLGQADAAADDKVDIFLIEADYALKYVNSDYALPVADLGIKDADLADQYQYTKDIVTDSEGVLKGLSWQAAPGVMFYNRDVALEVFGTEDPAEVQKYVKDWDTFVASAATLKAAGYQVCSSVMDTYRVYSNNVSQPWVVDGKIVVDKNIEKWVTDSKALFDAGYVGNHAIWGEEWNAGFYPEGKVFAYFGPAWLINFCMADGAEGSIATAGRWGATEGPQGFYWGGTWICAAAGTDNGDLVKDIMLQLTTNADVMKGIVEKDDDFANNKPTMEAMATSDYSSRILGGQNPLAMYAANADNLDLSNLSPYDQACNEEFQNAIQNYLDGKCTYEEALELFYTGVIEKHPELTK